MKSKITLETYEKSIARFDLYPVQSKLEAYTLGLASESGEVAGKVKKLLRGDEWSAGAIADELGDVLWYLSRLADTLGYSLQDIANRNYNKLSVRHLSGTIRGDGDER